MAKTKIDLSHPITSRANMIASLFASDPGVQTELFFYAHVLKIRIQDPERAKALASVIKPVQKLGKLQLDVKVYTLAGKTKKGAIKWAQVKVDQATGSANVCAAFDRAFDGNDNYAGTTRAKDPAGVVWFFVMMNKVGCQYLNDDIQNPWSTTTVLPQDIIKRAFNHKGVQITTVVE